MYTPAPPNKRSAGDPIKEEYFDVVNDRDEVIGQELRREVHRKGLKHRAVHVLVFNAKGHVFLQKRSLKKDQFPGTWDSSASGHLAPGETYDDAAVRETFEEIGLKLEAAPTRLFKMSACKETGQEFVWVYRCASEGPFKLDPTEVEHGNWFRADDITRWITNRPKDFAEAFIYLWKIGKF